MTDSDYREALARINELVLLDPHPSSPEGIELIRLADAIEAYAREHFDFNDPQS